MVQQNVIIFHNYLAKEILMGDPQDYYPLSWLSEDKLDLTPQCPETTALNLVAMIIADRKENGPVVKDIVKSICQLIFFDPCNPISINKDKTFTNDKYKSKDTCKVYIEGTFGKIIFSMLFENQKWTILDVVDADEDGIVTIG